MKRSILFFALLIGGLSAQVKVSIPEGTTNFGFNAEGQPCTPLCVLKDGDPQKIDQYVKLAFDAEYTIRIENFDQYRRVLAKVRIDGSEATDDGLILRTNETVNLERFVNSKTLQSGKRFKFVERNAALADGHRPNKEDGLIVVTVQFEKRVGKLVEYKEPERNNWCSPFLFHSSCNSVSCGIDVGIGGRTSNLGLTSYGHFTPEQEIDVSPGVTVEGSTSSQRFQEEKVGELEDRIDQIVIRLMGYYKEPKILLNK